MTMGWVLWILSLGAGESYRAAFDRTGGWLQFETPEQAGFASEALEEAYAMAAEGNTAALMIVYRGRVLAAWGRVASRYKCHSVRKSLYSALYGLYVDEGKINLDKTLAELDIGDIHGLSEEERRATVKDLISARSGIYHPAAKEPVSMKRARPERGSQKPGVHFFYNNWDFNTAAVILERATGEELFEAFRRRLAEPLGFQDFRPRDGFHEYDRAASQYPAHAFRLSARDMARFGQLYLQKGVWNGQRLLSEAWIHESTSTISKTSRMGYGYMWWVLEKGSAENDPGLSAYLASGTGGQAILVCEDAHMVLVHRGDTDHNRHAGRGELLNLFFKVLAGKTGEPAAHTKLVPMNPRPLPNRLPAMPDRQLVSVDRERLEQLAGRYQMPDGVVVTIYALDDHLVGSHPHLGEIDLFPASENRFVAYNANIEVQFTQDASGAPTSGELGFFGQKIPCQRVE